jgi:hypothetical protein
LYIFVVMWWRECKSAASATASASDYGVRYDHGQIGRGPAFREL